MRSLLASVGMLGCLGAAELQEGRQDWYPTFPDAPIEVAGALGLAGQASMAELASLEQEGYANQVRQVLSGPNFYPTFPDAPGGDPPEGPTPVNPVVDPLGHDLSVRGVGSAESNDLPTSRTGE